MTRTELTGVAGVPETAVTERLVAGLPANEAPAPWDCVCEAVVWFGRGGSAATAALPPAVRATGRARGLVVVGALVRYLETPVGPYDEVLGLVGSTTGRRPWGSVAFMAVDSPASLVGGRTNWAMPKTLATFDGDLDSGRTLTAAGADGLRWRVSATPRVVGPPLPLRTTALTRQEFPGSRVGDSTMRGKGRLRLAVVTVEADSDGPLPTWLRPGRHLGAVLERGTFSLAEPRF